MVDESNKSFSSLSAHYVSGTVQSISLAIQPLQIPYWLSFINFFVDGEIKA